MLQYREIPAPDIISHLILLFWEFRCDPSDEPILHEVLPDGCISIVYNRNLVDGYERFVTAGFRTEMLRVPLRAGDVFWGARITPSACASVVGEDPRNIAPSMSGLPANLELLQGEFVQELSESKCLEETAEVFARGLSRLGVTDRDIDHKVAAAVELIELSGGAERISDIAAELGLSLRQFQRRFLSATGFTPKGYARIRRLYRAARGLVEQDPTSWADKAFDAGFADQSHLTREVVALTGRTPASFADRVRTIIHSDLTK